MSTKLKKIMKIILIVILAVVLICVVYLGYIFASYSRIEDNQELTVDASLSGAAKGSLETNTEYSIMTYNIGFGAYSPDYSFFMDGGTESWAFSKEAVIENVTNAASLVESYDPDFTMMEEVDINGTRSYHVDEYELVRSVLKDYQSSMAVDYDSKFLMYPLTQPHGANKSSLALFSKYDISSALRRSFPISESFSKVVDLDRCYEIARVEAGNGKQLVLITAHLSAYSEDDSVRKGQLDKLFGDIQAEYDKGNYVICGGDFNHDLKLDDSTDDSTVASWAHALPRSYMGENLRLVLDDYMGTDNVAWNTTRNADKAYDPATSYTVTVDGFIVSDNIEVTDYEHINTGYSNSDHDPVLMKFKLKEAQ